MKIIRGKNNTRIDLKNLGSVEISFPHCEFGINNKGGINWSGSGTRNIKDTRLFINALQKAIEIYNKQKG